LLPLDQLYTQQLLMFVFKCLYNNYLVPPVFTILLHAMAKSTGTVQGCKVIYIYLFQTHHSKKRIIKYKCRVLWNIIYQII